MPKTLQEFYAVTLHPISIFKATTMRDGEGFPIVQCLATREKSHCPPRSCLKRGKLIAVTRQGLILYDDSVFHSPAEGPQPPSRIEEVGYSNRGERTGAIVALLGNPSDAFNCFHALGLKCLDLRWKKETTETLARISDVHPTFVISRSPLNAFIYNNPLEP